MEAPSFDQRIPEVESSHRSQAGPISECCHSGGKGQTSPFRKFHPGLGIRI
jgi:hypothetical protein